MVVVVIVGNVAVVVFVAVRLADQRQSHDNMEVPAGTPDIGVVAQQSMGILSTDCQSCCRSRYVRTI